MQHRAAPHPRPTAAGPPPVRRLCCVAATLVTFTDNDAPNARGGRWERRQQHTTARGRGAVPDLRGHDDGSRWPTPQSRSHAWKQRERTAGAWTRSAAEVRTNGNSLAVSSVGGRGRRREEDQLYAPEMANTKNIIGAPRQHMAYFNYMGMLAAEGTYDKIEALLNQDIHPAAGGRGCGAASCSRRRFASCARRRVAGCVASCSRCRVAGRPGDLLPTRPGLPERREVRERRERREEREWLTRLTRGAHVGPTLTQLPHRPKPGSKPPKDLG
uniref:Uncharacterized protein n=1 Tax=Oryza sativa subsp. japonica TaxID=39947 RepID=Q7Y1I3_ORYSJ|nr:hypothetical protein [Oryza sativa Japonica Group]